MGYSGKTVYVKFRDKVGKITHHQNVFHVTYISAPWRDYITNVRTHCAVLCTLDRYLITGSVTDV